MIRRIGGHVYKKCTYTAKCTGDIEYAYWKCLTCGERVYGEWACTECKKGGVPRYNYHYKNEMKYTCTTHSYTGSSSSHTYTENCDHGYSSSHYYCSTHNWKGSTSSHSYTTSKSCEHGKYSTHSYCSHDKTSTHYLN